MAANRRRHKSRSESGSFLALPHKLLRSHCFASASPRATKLLLDVAVEFNGTNNGDLNAVMSRLKHRGWNSSSQLSKAKSELLNMGLLVETRQGGLYIGPSLYALGWLPLGSVRRKLDLSADAYEARRIRLSSLDKAPVNSRGGAT